MHLYSFLVKTWFFLFFFFASVALFFFSFRHYKLVVGSNVYTIFLAFPRKFVFASLNVWHLFHSIPSNWIMCVHVHWIRVCMSLKRFHSHHVQYTLSRRIVFLQKRTRILNWILQQAILCLIRSSTVTLVPYWMSNHQEKMNEIIFTRTKNSKWTESHAI